MGTKETILIIDDEPKILEAVKSCFKDNAGNTVLEARSRDMEQCVSVIKPILIAGKAAQKIARIYSGQIPQQFIRINEDYRTKELKELSRSVNTLAGEPEEVLRLTTLVRDLNTLTGLEWETITLNKTEFDLAKLLQITAEQFKSKAVEKGVTINLSLAESTITAGYGRLKQVFINIFSNALKYTDKGGITLTTETASETSGFQCLVSIAGTGIGIPEDDLPHIFERFYRGDKSRSRSA